MPVYKFTYFNGRGRGELVRLVFAAAGQKFEDVRVEFSDWAKIKPETPNGTLPMLEIDGKKASQSVAIARYLAREFNMYGKTNADMLIVDQIIDQCVDMFTAFVKIVFNKDEAEKESQMKSFYEETFPKNCGILEKLVQGSNDFVVGSTLSLGDLALFSFIENCAGGDKLDKFPRLAANRKRVEQLPKINEYLKSRPSTQF